ncbi:MAG TPA: MerR family DNA-binding transcriptional regulator [Gaiellaceae bacterium]|nr:MerR family DNA-binding transcriptional regulator [Gaiellaceae bacterium]
MPRGRKTTNMKKGAASPGRMRAAEVSPALRDRLDQARVLRDPRVRALWPRLEPRQQGIVLDPRDATGHRYPLTSGEVSELTGLSERQVRYWADRGLIVHWRKGSRRLFEAVGLITAFSIRNASQHELQFYRGLIEEPVDELAAKMGMLTSVLASRLENVEPGEAKTVTAALVELTQR